MPGITPEQVANLAAPFAPEAVHWRAQTVTERDGKHKALALAYLDARDVQDRLDSVCGPENWEDSYIETPKGRIIGTIRIRIGEAWISKSDGAGDTDVEGEKGALSDALKRAAVKWGIGRYLYNMPNVWVPCEVGNNGKFRKFLDDPWKHVRGFSPPAPKAVPDAVQTMLGEIEACETQIVLQRWWKNNNEKIPDAHYDRVLKAADDRRVAIDAMDRAAA
jgi:hypothetical protein